MIFGPPLFGGQRNVGQVVFQNEGGRDTLATTWQVPGGVTEISAVAVGTGGNGSIYEDSGIGGGGGALSYLNLIPVVPGETLQILIEPGGSFGEEQPNRFSGLLRDGVYLLRAQVGGNPLGGDANNGVGAVRYSGGRAYEVVRDSSNSDDLSSGGGGAAGYGGDGGRGGEGARGIIFDTVPAEDGSGGGGGGGGRRSVGSVEIETAGGGGGVGVLTAGESGSAGDMTNSGPSGGGGGSGGEDGGDLFNPPPGGKFGGGCGAAIRSSNNDDESDYIGGPGAVRIIWGFGRSYPNNSEDV